MSSSSQQQQQQELERQLLNLQQLDACSRDVIGQCKSASGSLRKCAPSEWELVQGLMQHADRFPDLQAKLDAWQQHVRAKELAYEQMVDLMQRFVSKPMQQLQKLRPAVDKVAKKRDKRQADEASLVATLAKEEGKSRSGKRLAQIAYLRKDLQAARTQVAEMDSYLRSDLQQLNAMRGDYVRPCLKALLHAEAQLFGQLADSSAKVADCFADSEDLICLSADSYQEVTRQRLKEIRALSIVADPE